MSPRAVIFDMGNVLIDWDPDRTYRQLLPDPQDRAKFFVGLFRRIHNLVHDTHRPFDEVLAPLKESVPDEAHLIELFEKDWYSFLHGPLPETVVLLEALHARGVPLYGLSNWPHQTWPPRSADRSHDYDFLARFEDIVVSGTVGMRKPNADIYLHALARFGLSAQEVVFVDDLEENVRAAEALGISAHHFQGAAGLRDTLVGYGLLD
ncbi:MAG: HAD family phosphatase [Parvibaculum sp.]